MIKKYKLNFQKAKNYFEENLKGVNQLSNSVLSFLNFDYGNFFALLTEKSPINEIHEFKTGGKTNCLRIEVSKFVFELFKQNSNISYIFDDFNSDEKNTEGDTLFNSHGIFCNDEIYYLINNSASQDLILKCLQRSNVIWHSLCIVSEINFKENKKTVSPNELEKICLNAKLVMIGAYDSESYIYWERSNSFKIIS